jgi:hypothetical protein
MEELEDSEEAAMEEDVNLMEQIEAMEEVNQMEEDQPVQTIEDLEGVQTFPDEQFEEEKQLQHELYGEHVINYNKKNKPTPAELKNQREMMQLQKFNSGNQNRIDVVDYEDDLDDIEINQEPFQNMHQEEMDPIARKNNLQNQQDGLNLREILRNNRIPFAKVFFSLF